jgi:hypothetical protein
LFNHGGATLGQSLVESVAADGVGVAADRYGGAPEARVRERGAEFAQLASLVIVAGEIEVDFEIDRRLRLDGSDCIFTIECR